MIIRIGRDPRSDFVVKNKTASRTHAELEVTDGRIILRDVDSKSGTYVLIDDKLERINYRQVTERDTILVGNEQLRVKDIIEHAARKNRNAVYEKNPITGEIIKK